MYNSLFPFLSVFIAKLHYTIQKLYKYYTIQLFTIQTVPDKHYTNKSRVINTSLRFPRNSLGTNAEAVKLEKRQNRRGFIISALLASGFRKIPFNNKNYATVFEPCPLGTFSNSSSSNEQGGCIQCPPGILCFTA